MRKNHSGNTKLFLWSVCEQQYKLNQAAVLYLPKGSTLLQLGKMSGKRGTKLVTSSEDSVSLEKDEKRTSDER